MERTVSFSDLDEVLGTYNEPKQAKCRRKKLTMKQWHQSLGDLACIPLDVVLIILAFLIIPSTMISEFKGITEEIDKREASQRDAANFARRQYKKKFYGSKSYWQLGIRPESYLAYWLIKFMQTCKYAKHISNMLRKRLGHMTKVGGASSIVEIEQKVRKQDLQRKKRGIHNAVRATIAKVFAQKFADHLELNKMIPNKSCNLEIFRHPINTGKLADTNYSFADIFDGHLMKSNKLRGRKKTRTGQRMKNLISEIVSMVYSKLEKLPMINNCRDWSVRIYWITTDGPCVHADRGCRFAHCRHLVWRLKIEKRPY